MDVPAPFPTPSGDYHLFAYSDAGGGGIRATAPDEQPGSTPTVHVEDTGAAYEAAPAAGAEAVDPLRRVMAGVCAALVRAPGGVLIGFSGPTQQGPAPAQTVPDGGPRNGRSQRLVIQPLRPWPAGPPGRPASRISQPEPRV